MEFNPYELARSPQQVRRIWKGKCACCNQHIVGREVRNLGDRLILVNNGVRHSCRIESIELIKS